MHILIWLYDMFSILDLTLQNMQNECASLFIPNHELHKKTLLEIGRKEATRCLGEESYTLSDRRESFGEQGYILIWNFFKRPKLFSRRFRVDLILHIGINFTIKSLKKIIGYEKEFCQKILSRFQVRYNLHLLEKHRLWKSSIRKAEVSSPRHDHTDWGIGSAKFLDSQVVISPYRHQSLGLGYI